MSAVNDNGARLTQFKNKGKDASVSSASNNLHFKLELISQPVVMYAVLYLLWVSTSTGAEAKESGSQRGAPESKERRSDPEEEKRPEPSGRADLSSPRERSQRTGRAQLMELMVSSTAPVTRSLTA